MTPSMVLKNKFASESRRVVRAESTGSPPAPAEVSLTGRGWLQEPVLPAASPSDIDAAVQAPCLENTELHAMPELIT